jgi:hypothetical protein
VTKTAAELEQGWRLAESRGPVDQGSVIADPLPVMIADRRLFVGVSAAGSRHLLLPISGPVAIGRPISGAAVQLSSRSLLLDGQERLYADVSCSRGDLFDEFSVLAAEIIAEVTADPTTPAETASRVIARWRELLRAISLPTLERSAVIGLYAELLLLERILTHDPRRRIDCWTGPRRARHDFQRGPIVLDVKGSTARRGRPIVIHGIDQLETPPNAALYLWWVHLETGVGRGQSLRAQVHKLLDRVVDPTGLEHELIQAGYDFDNEESYDAPLLTELDARLYRVDASFPRLTRAHLVGGDLPARVTALSYEVDLSGDTPQPLDPAQEAEIVRALAGVT